MSDDDEQHISEDEWANRFGWSVNDSNTANLLEESNTDIVMLLRRIDQRFVWSQQDRDDGGCGIVPGMTPNALGYYLTDRPRATPEDENIVAIIPPIDDN